MTGLARAYAVALSGLEGTVVEVQTHIGPGLVGTNWLGSPMHPCVKRKRGCAQHCFPVGSPR